MLIWRLLKSSTIYASHKATYKRNIVTIVTLLNPYLTHQTCLQLRPLICIITVRPLSTVPKMIKKILPHSENAVATLSIAYHDFRQLNIIPLFFSVNYWSIIDPTFWNRVTIFLILQSQNTSRFFRTAVVLIVKS